MNVQHSSRTDAWFTPLDILERARRVLGPFDLDPASCAVANARVQAAKFYTEEENGLTLPWYGAVFCNPPGGKLANRSLTGLFWEKLLAELPNSDHAIFLCFSIEAMQSTQRAAWSVGQFPFCIPARRIAFDRPDGTRGAAPSHSNMIVYVPGRIYAPSVFAGAFRDLGLVRL